MSEDDRAAKAARAKAMLKKRQQKKAHGPSITPEVASPSSPPSSRPFSPALPEPAPVEDEQKVVADLFATRESNDTSWISSLPRAAPPTVSSIPSNLISSPPLKPSSHSHAATISNVDGGVLKARTDALELENTSLSNRIQELQVSQDRLRETEVLLGEERKRSQQLSEDLHQLQAERETLLRNEQQTISLLVSEKASLASELERLEGLESEAQSTKSQLEKERNQSSILRSRLERLESDLHESSHQNEQLRVKDKELTEKNREQERELQLCNAASSNLQKEVDEYKRRLRELEEQIQSDDRVEKLEITLKNTQDRNDELEFQLSKLKQAHATLKDDRDRTDAELKQHRDSAEAWKSKHSTLEAEHETIQNLLASNESEKTALNDQNIMLRSEIDSTQKDITLLQEKLTQAAVELASSNRQLQAAQIELKNAKRRAEEAERIQIDLQSEGTNLMQSLAEMRPKVVELTGAKLELSDKVDSLEGALRSRNATIAQLEATLDDHRDHREQAELKWSEILARHEKDRLLEQDASTKIQKAFTEMQDELESSLASIRALEADRTSYHHDTARQLQEIERLNQSTVAQAQELVALRQEIAEGNNIREDEEEFISQAQSEIEGLRQAIETKDKEIESLLAAANPSSGSEGPHSLDDEILGAIKQQHSLELSASQSKIRSLETALFEADARSHAMQKQISALEDQLSLRPRSFSPIPSRPSSRGSAIDLHRASFNSHRSTLPPSLSRAAVSRTAVLDQGLSPETRHKRKVSLSMLKARIESESAVGLFHPASRNLSPVPSESSHGPDSQPSSPPLNHPHHHPTPRPQFLDDSHVFWCHSCHGDLVIL
ncbi:uncharacterized protein BT62DRAFT_926359 [Guyanagaster necrorhizus]|uniref:Uncharacterized protein n=1 Tax=Guyanagaster necrorhizus TaxID=856835 RepID=A0A9P7W489_9AGAR|nr:uncharacterized protein BT62DRAFT_926359 [Guyanagaster necrorhizus MCA 3950]KAG7452140.1 hypothetical protein BT62DRAFT_926359 [Guyanagaster necrorhizus MCA 3950]